MSRTRFKYEQTLRSLDLAISTSYYEGSTVKEYDTKWNSSNNLSYLIDREWVISDVKNCTQTSGQKNLLQFRSSCRNSTAISKQWFQYNRLWCPNSPFIIRSGINLSVLSGWKLINAPRLTGWGPIFGITSQTACSPHTPLTSQCVPLANYITGS
jgi:hypothetical protein